MPILLIVAVVVAAGVGVFFLLSGDDDSGPEAVAERYVQATIDGDCDEIVGLLVLDGESEQELRDGCESLYAGDGELADLPAEALDALPSEVVSTTVDDESDSTATVTVEYRTRGGSTDSEQLALVKQDGDWKVNVTDPLPSPEDGTDLPEDEAAAGGGDPGRHGRRRRRPGDRAPARQRRGPGRRRARRPGELL